MRRKRCGILLQLCADAVQLHALPLQLQPLVQFSARRISASFDKLPEQVGLHILEARSLHRGQIDNAQFASASGCGALGLQPRGKLRLLLWRVGLAHHCCHGAQGLGEGGLRLLGPLLKPLPAPIFISDRAEALLDHLLGHRAQRNVFRLLASDGQARECGIALAQPRHDARIDHRARLASRIDEKIRTGDLHALLGIVARFVEQSPLLQPRGYFDVI